MGALDWPLPVGQNESLLARRGGFSFDTFSVLYESGRQPVPTSDRPRRRLSNQDPMVKARSGNSVR
jgi:hypothetical protein